MLTWWARKTIRYRRLVLAGALVLAAAGISWGTGVFGMLVSGGFEDPGSQSALAAPDTISIGAQQGSHSANKPIHRSRRASSRRGSSGP